MTPAAFFRSHGLLVEDPRHDGRWHRVPTDDHPKKKNGAYRWEGDAAFCRNWATMADTAIWRDDTVRTITLEDRRKAAARRELLTETQEKNWIRAAERARALMADCRAGQHGYAQRKGFSEAKVLVMPDNGMFLPMRGLLNNELVGAQQIHWLAEERRWEKRFLPGMRAKGAVFRMGPPRAKELLLCEGWATGMSLVEAAELLHLQLSVVVCFSTSNIVHVAGQLSGRRYVFADHDAPERDPERWIKNPGEQGQRAAAATGLPWTMAPREDEDANDLHRHEGIRALCGLVLELRRMKRPPEWKPAPEPTSEAQA